jgi:cell division protein ZipA
MDGLRLWLLLFGLLVVAGVYLYSRREQIQSEDKVTTSPRVEPSLDGNDNSDDVADPHAIESTSLTASEDDEAEVTPPVAQKIVTVRLVAREKKTFAGDELVLSMRGIGLRHGKFGIFHRYDGNDETKVVFSAASLIEPGSFDLQNIKGQEIPGISLFLIMPGPMDCVEAFDSMLAAARAMTQSLDGELLDESGSTLSIQRERYLREEMIQFQHSSLVS